MQISVEGTGKNQLEPGQGDMGNDPVLSHCSLTETNWCAGALS